MSAIPAPEHRCRLALAAVVVLLLLAAAPSRGAGRVPIFGRQAALGPDAASDSATDFNGHVATDGAGTWVAVWQSREAGADSDLLVSRSGDDGASWSVPTLLHASLAVDAGDDTAPHLATDAAGTWLVVWESTSALVALDDDPDVVVARSTDGGQSWSAPALLDPIAPGERASDLAPHLAYAGAGSWVALWQSNDLQRTGDADFDILVSRSTDGGVTWSSSALLDGAASADLRNDTGPWVTGDGSGTLVAVWNADEALANFATDTDVLVSRSIDGGVSWTPPAPLNPSEDNSGGRDDYDGRVATDGAGTWLAVWESDDSPNDDANVLGLDFDILAARSSDGGASWTPPFPVNRNASIDSGMDLDPQVSVDAAGTWVTVWQSSDGFGATGNDFDVLAASSTDGGVTWTPPAPLHPEFQTDGEGDFDPALTTDGAGHWVAVSYGMDPQGGDVDIHVSRGGAPFGPAAALATDAAGDAALDADPALAVGAGDWLAVWASENPAGGLGTDSDILLARSSDAGASWTDPVALASNAASDSGDDASPELAGDGAGTWLAVWASDDPLGGLGSDLDLLLSRSLDGGQTWSAPVALNTNAAVDSGADRSPHIATDGAGHWLVVWTSNDPLGGIGQDEDILMARSNDLGVTWTPPVPLDPGAAFDFGADRDARVATDGDVWLVVWSSADPTTGLGTDFDILVARSQFLPAGWSSPVPLDAAAVLDVGADVEPWIGTDGSGTWLAAWSSTEPQGGLGTDSDVLTARSSDGGQSWTPPVALADDAATDSGRDARPQLAGDGAGNWVAVWESDEDAGGLGTDDDLRLARSGDGGLSWSAPLPLNSEARSDSAPDRVPRLATDGSGAWVAVWISEHPLGGSSGTDPDVLFARGAGPDQDGDGLADGAEVGIHGTAPGAVDSDADGLTDAEELIVHGSNPLDDDSDGDGVPDWVEVFLFGTSPTATDTDGDGLPDDQEILVYETDPTRSDSDGDGLDDPSELFDHGTDPLDPDTDGDGFSDGIEVGAGFDPLDPASKPRLPPDVPALGPFGLILLVLLFAGMGLQVLGPSRQETRRR